MKKNLFTFAFTYALITLFSLAAKAQEGVVSVSQDKDITKLLEFKKDLKTVDLFKIQIYSGNRAGAEKAKNEFRTVYGDWPVDMEFDTPYYKIQVGNFRSRLEADRALIKIKKNYGNAFIFASKKDRKNP